MDAKEHEYGERCMRRVETRESRQKGRLLLLLGWWRRRRRGGIVLSHSGRIVVCWSGLWSSPASFAAILEHPIPALHV